MRRLKHWEWRVLALAMASTGATAAQGVDHAAVVAIGAPATAPGFEAIVPAAPLGAEAAPVSPAPGADEEAPLSQTPETDSVSHVLLKSGMASWYGPRFHGRRTANGERYNMHDLTAAHRYLPFGTLVKVRSVHTGKSVVVRINDRGPYKHQRIIDLSRAAMDALGTLGRGVTLVEVWIEEPRLTEFQSMTEQFLATSAVKTQKRRAGRPVRLSAHRIR